MKKAPDAFRTISEVADWLDVQAHVLRFWESKFTQVKPVKRAGGRRYYRPADMLLIGGIKTLLHDEGMTIKGVQKILREKGLDYVSSLSRPLEAGAENASDTTVNGTVVDAMAEATPDAHQAGDSDETGDVADAPMAIEAQEDPSETQNVVAFQRRKPTGGLGEASAAPAQEAPADPDPDKDTAEPQATAPAPSDTGPAADSAKDASEQPDTAAQPPALQETPDPQDSAAQAAAPASSGTDTQDNDQASSRASSRANDQASDQAGDQASGPKDPQDKAPAAPRDTAAAKSTAPQADLFEDMPEDQPQLPSFLHRSARAEPEPEEEPTPEPEADSGPARPRQVDAPDPPAEDEIDAAPGLLGRLAALETLPTDQIDQVKALADTLRSHLSAAPADKASGAP